MLRVVRCVAGSSWAPPQVRAESPDSDWMLGAEDFCNRHLDFESDAIAIPYDLLDLRLPRGTARDTETDPASAEDGLPDAPNDLAGSLQQALHPLIGAEHLSIELTAEIAETSARTLRRRLSEEGTSFRGILDRILFEAVEERLGDTDAPIKEISAELGYANEANFARAFKRWTGESPSTYRRRRRLH